MLVTLSGIVILVRLAHSAKAEGSMVITLSGIVMLVRLPQPLKAPLPMLVTGLPLMVSGMTISPDASSSQSVIFTASPFISLYFISLHPDRATAIDIDNSRAGLIKATMPVASASGHYKQVTRLHRHPIPVQEPRCGARVKGAVCGLGVRCPTTIRPPLCNRVPRFRN